MNYNEDIKDLLQDFTTIPALQTADFILLQEVTGTVGIDDNGARQIAQALNMNYVFAPAVVADWLKPTPKDYGNAILSRWPLGQFRKVLLPPSAKENCNQRIALGVTANVAGRLIQIYSVHLSVTFPDTVGNDRERAIQLKSALDQMDVAPAGMPTFFSGDLNTANPFGIRTIYELVATRHFTDAHPLKGYTDKTHHFTLDHAFARGFSVLRAGTSYEAKGSDHVPIWSDLVLP